MMSTVLFSATTYVVAAIAEIAGCFAFWAWLRLDKPAWWLAPGLVSLALFAYLLTRIDSGFAGRAYAPQDRSISSRNLTRHQAEPSTKVAAAGKSRSVSDRGNDGTGNGWTDAWHR